MYRIEGKKSFVFKSDGVKMNIRVTKMMISQIKHYIKSNEVTQEWFSRQCGVSKVRISILINGINNHVRLETWEKIKETIGGKFKVTFFGRKFNSGGIDENYQLIVKAMNMPDAWIKVGERHKFDVVKKISCEAICLPNKKRRRRTFIF